jgi:hypothetical protein
MSQAAEAAIASDPTERFVDRRREATEAGYLGRERRQFTNSHSELSAGAKELAEAVDAYKLRHRRRFINYEELYSVLESLGYHK